VEITQEDVSSPVPTIKLLRGEVKTLLGQWTGYGAEFTGVIRVRMEMMGSVITVFVDGVERISVVDATYTAAGRAFLYVTRYGRLNDFRAESL
jgi:hypothetical protein